MAITNGYLTLVEFKAGLEMTSMLLDPLAEECIETASRDIDGALKRRFYADSVATARVFASAGSDRVYVDDMWAAPTLVKSDDADTGAYGTTWTVTTDYVLDPPNGIGPNGQPGWPYTSLVAVAGRYFPYICRPFNVQVTAKWGWAAVPTDVKNACRRLAQMRYEARNAPFGVAGIGDMGAVRIKSQPILDELARTYGGTFGVAG